MAVPRSQSPNLPAHPSSSTDPVANLPTSRHNMLTGFPTVVSHLRIDDLPVLEKLLKNIDDGHKIERSQSITVICHNEHKLMGASAVFDDGADDNTAELSVVTKLGIPWTRIEDLPEKLQSRMGLVQYDGTRIKVLGIAVVQWSLRNVEGVLFTTPVKVVEDGHGQEILIGRAFRRDLRKAIAEVKYEHENGPSCFNRIVHQGPISRVMRLFSRPISKLTTSPQQCGI
ncbi:hypothetical protein AYO20_00706 [Fonsecaea nubica]|uniref:Uncharacterized protein n=1 Tax=Fonsecaea nubica TaxID=856822 RepID=A0A178DEP3_9EURO|nr:hypothetical protein AYO20_00706 [Fonsecaea nubica]OAL39794.1 hypothetical protein AYO20_00706 [Fonsecaea nubica]